MSARIGYEEAARYLGVPAGTLRSMVARKQIPHIRISPQRVVFEVADLDRWLDERRVPAAGGAR